MPDRNKVIAIAIAETGYLEKSKSAYQKNPDILNEKTAGAGRDNYTKYGKEMYQRFLRLPIKEENHDEQNL